jgi:hypothetical protein
MQEVSSLDQSTLWADHVSHSASFSACLCGLWIWKRSPGPAVWVIAHTKHHQKTRNQQKGTLETDLNAHLSTESNQEGPALSKEDEWVLGTNQTGEAAVDCSSVETDCLCDEEDAKLSLVTSTVLTGSDPDKEVVQKAATIPSGWTCAKL